MSNADRNEGASTDSAWAAALRLLERVIFTPGIAAVCKLLLILVVLVGLMIVATRAGVPAPWGATDPVLPSGEPAITITLPVQD